MNQARNALQFTIWYQITEIGANMEDRYLFKAKHIHILPGNDHLDGSWVVGFLSGERYIANDSGEYLIDPSTICQCTGLKDKNGKLIWENDIVKGKYYDKGKSHRHIGQVKYTCEAYKVVGVKQYTGYHDCLNGSYEVIGNIFNNPELLGSEG